jgi:hypothetical protein
MKTEGQGNPLKVERTLAVMWAQSQIKAPRPNALYIASGFGEHVETLLPRMDAEAYLVIYEASLKDLKATLASKDWSVVLGDPRVFLFAGEATAVDFELLHQMSIARIDQVIPARFSPAWQLDEKAYGEFFSEIARQFEVVRKLHLTSFNDGIFWQSTTFPNLPHHCQAPDVRALENIFPDVPVVLAGAGPSLDEAEEFLKKIADRAVIIAVNSSYRKLRKIGIKPHMVLAADPRDDTCRGFDGQITDDGTYLVSPFIVNPRVVKAFAGHTFSWSGENNALVAALRKRLGLREGTVILEKGTVSLSVADLAFLMGARQLILVGQDMAIAGSGLTHTKDSFYGGYKMKEKELENARRVPGNTTPEVMTLDNL